MGATVFEIAGGPADPPGIMCGSYLSQVTMNLDTIGKNLFKLVKKKLMVSLSFRCFDVIVIAMYPGRQLEK